MIENRKINCQFYKHTVKTIGLKNYTQYIPKGPSSDESTIHVII